MSNIMCMPLLAIKQQVYVLLVVLFIMLEEVRSEPIHVVFFTVVITEDCRQLELVKYLRRGWES